MQEPGLTQKAIHGSFYTITSSGIVGILNTARSILLARLLLPEHFGVIALAMVFFRLVQQLRSSGLDMALIQQQDPSPSFLRTYFSLRVGLDLAASGLLIAGIPIIRRGYPQVEELGLVLLVLAGAFLLSSLNHTQEVFLRKHLSFAPLATIDITASLIMTAVAPYLAWRGWGVWALVAEEISGMATRLLLNWGPFRQWWPAFGWDRNSAAWLWKYGKSTWMSTNLNYLLNQFDDFWIGTAFGSASLGFYAKAFEFARYPSLLIGNQLVAVFMPIFSQLQGKTVSLSQAFYRSAYVMLRLTCLAAGGLMLAAPELIHFVIGDHWLSILWILRVMLVYAILAPLLLLVKKLFFATGQPQEVLHTSWAQVACFLPAVIFGAGVAGIHGVAVAANIMLLAGLWKAYRPLRRTVDFSLFRLAGYPLISLAIAWGAGLWVETVMSGDVWQVLLLKCSLFLTLFTAFMVAFEWREYLAGAQLVLASLRTGRER